MSGLAKKIEITTNVAIIVAAIVIVAVGAQRLLLPGSAGSRSSHQLAPGSKLAIPGVNWQRNGKSLVLAFSPTCRFCTESAPFYRKLVQEANDGASARLVGIFPEYAECGNGYLARLGIRFPTVVGTRLDKLGVTGTPTLMLVDQRGVITNVWMGKLPPAQENDVLRRVRRRA